MYIIHTLIHVHYTCRLIVLLTYCVTVGLAYDTLSKDLSKKSKAEGLHNGPPGFEFIIFPSVYKSLSFSSLKVHSYFL